MTNYRNYKESTQRLENGQPNQRAFPLLKNANLLQYLIRNSESLIDYAKSLLITISSTSIKNLLINIAEVLNPVIAC